MSGPEKCLDSNSLRIITKFFAVPTFLVKRMQQSFAIGTLLRKPPARTTPMDRLLISPAFLLCTHVHPVAQESQLCSCLRNSSETQIDTTMTFSVPIVSIEQNEEFQESRVHYTLAGIKSLLKIGGSGGVLDARGGFRNLWNPPLATPLKLLTSPFLVARLRYVWLFRLL